jgi:hypothetical protein
MPIQGDFYILVTTLEQHTIFLEGFKIDQNYFINILSLETSIVF